MKKIFSLLFFIIFITGCGNKYQTINYDKAIELIDNGAIIIDVREVNEFNDGHIEGAYNIPLSNIESVDYELDSTIIVYCASGMRSMEAAKKLSDMGYTSLYNLDGGLINWGETLVK